VKQATTVFTWYVKTYGPEVNLFVDHSQIVQLEALRAGLWGTTRVGARHQFQARRRAAADVTCNDGVDVRVRPAAKDL
jgi:hypothetical protein